MEKFSKLMKGYADGQGGQFAIIASMIILVLMGVSGLAIDRHQMDLQKTRAQDALDSAALAFANEETAENLSQHSQKIREYINANYGQQTGTQIKQIQSEITPEGHLRVTSELRVEPLVGKMFGVNRYTMNVESVVSLPSGTIFEAANVAIAWDVSTSMTSLLPNVKSAVTALNAELDAQNFDGEFSVFPYSQYNTNRNIHTLISEADFQLDKLAIESYVNNLAIMSNTPTHTDGGAACGWEALEQANATMETVPGNELNVIFFMHDGDGFCMADDKILEQCQIIRDRGINLIAVRFGGFSSKEQLFLDCVGGNSSKYFYINSAETAVEAFFEGTFGNEHEKYIVR